MTIETALQTLAGSPFLSLILVLVLLLGRAWILVGSAQRRRN